MENPAHLEPALHLRSGCFQTVSVALLYRGTMDKGNDKDDDKEEDDNNNNNNEEEE